MKIFIGVDLHKTQFTVCVWRGKKAGEFDRYATTEEGYGAFLKRVKVWQKSGKEVFVGVESTGNTRFFKKKMEAAWVRVTVINTLKFKVVNESVKKTDRHDAATIAEFLAKDMLPESKLCSEKSEQMRRLLHVRTSLVRQIVLVKNQIHSLLVAIGIEDTKASLQSKRGRQRVLDVLKQAGNELVVQPLFEIIDSVDENVNKIEEELRKLVGKDRAIELLTSIPGCGEITAWTIMAFIDDIKRFSDPKKLVAYAGLCPWVQNSNETVHHGKITKRGPEELRTALVQLVMGMLRQKELTVTWRIMERYRFLKTQKGSGKSIIATARKLTVIIWHMLTNDEEFNTAYMIDEKLAKKAVAMRDNNSPSVSNGIQPDVAKSAAKGAVKKNNTKCSPPVKPEVKNNSALPYTLKKKRKLKAS
jgi:transposase